jgi:hypothetical protein
MSAHRRPRACLPGPPGLDSGRAPQVTDRQGQGVGGVGGLGPVGHPQQPHDHQRHLVLVGPAAAGHRRLDLARRVQRHRQAAPRGAHDRHRAGLCGAHHGPHVVLAEDPLYRHRVRLVLGQPAVDLYFDRQQPARDVLVRGGTDHAGRDEARRPAGHAFDHAESAPREARVDAEDTSRRARGIRGHRTQPIIVRPTVPSASEHLFATLPRRALGRPLRRLVSGVRSCRACTGLPRRPCPGLCRPLGCRRTPGRLGAGSRGVCPRRGRPGPWGPG